MMIEARVGFASATLNLEEVLSGIVRQAAAKAGIIVPEGVKVRVLPLLVPGALVLTNELRVEFYDGASKTALVEVVAAARPYGASEFALREEIRGKSAR